MSTQLVITTFRFIFSTAWLLTTELSPTATSSVATTGSFSLVIHVSVALLLSDDLSPFNSVAPIFIPVGLSIETFAGMFQQ